ncbi:recombinase family protein [Paracraurococcus lichenis]|uniref:Recombinase family protein n=1 Tax=Paracraurococcus lichenis TaxID=3064888 RepID=A0ABT9E920_9PROT|nr:recombinase family protein [Paracraurococcus sp. LOR1-02]MDO9712440.1 recombinase family protein [Paracraurococcus sp. LOR1-02]
MARKPLQVAAGPPRFIAYFRVSTEKQGRSGLGLEAQRAAVERHVQAAGGTIMAEFVEVESGKRSDRPEVAKAIAACRARRATLIIAKLDRLARNVAFISHLMESGVEFVAADMPTVTRLTVHILAAVAEEEARMISARTKAALQQAKARGVKLGNPRLRAGDASSAEKARQVYRQQAQAYTDDLRPYVEAAQRAGATSLNQIAAALQARGIRTPLGRETWSAWQVSRLLAALRPAAS